MKKLTVFDYILFIVMGILGFCLFLVPFSLPIEGHETSTIFIAHFNAFLSDNFENPITYIAIGFQSLVIISVFVGIYRRITKFQFKSEFINGLCGTTIPMIIMKFIGSVFFILLAVQNLGMNLPSNVVLDTITNPDTGGTTYGLVMSLFITFFAGIALLPLLTDFGAVEFIGNLASRFMNKLFKVPGYAAIDAVASFVGDGTIGIIVTDNQYQKGYYTQRQAAVIATSFSIVGIAFATLVAEELGFSDHFFVFYGSIFLVTIILGIIISRVRLFHFSDDYYDVNTSKPEDKAMPLREAFTSGVLVAKNNNILTTLKNVGKQIITTYITFVPTIMCVGTFGLIIAETTPIFQWISLPFIPILEFLGFGESATAMAPALFVGFADMYLPTLFVIDPSVVVSSAGKFFIGVVSFSQLIFLSETGMILLNTKIGFRVIDMIKLFIFRTLLAIPITLLITYLLSLSGIVEF